MITQIDEQFNQQAAAAAQLRLDAEAGREFMRNLAIKHFEQGYFAGQCGLDPERAGLWSPDHMRGFAVAQAGQQPQFVNVGGLPALWR